MAIRLNDSTAIIKRLTNLVQGNQDTFVGVWCRPSYIPVNPDYITIVSKQDLDIAAYTQWAGIYTDVGATDGFFEIDLSNGGAPTSTPGALVGIGASYFTYRKIGTNHLFYVNSILAGSVLLDFSAVVFNTILLGNDRNGGVLGPIDFMDYIEYSNAKSEGLILAQMNSVGVPVDLQDIVAFTPLLNNLDDISGQNNNWIGSGNFSFISNFVSTGFFPITAGGGLAPTQFGLDNNESMQYDNVPVGDGYSIIENTPPGYQTTYQVSNGSSHTNISVGLGETVVITITNRRLANETSGIYKIVPGKKQDTLWLENFVGTRNVKIP